MKNKGYDPEKVPSPDDLYDIAVKDLEESGRLVPLSAYRKTINLLRSKGYSWRKIADFLRKNGIDVTHNEVYYVTLRDLEESPGVTADDLNQMVEERSLQEHAES